MLGEGQKGGFPGELGVPLRRAGPDGWAGLAFQSLVLWFPVVVDFGCQESKLGKVLLTAHKRTL